MALDHDDEGTYIEYVLDCGHYGVGRVHTGKCLGGLRHHGAEAKHGEDREETHGDPSCGTGGAGRSECVVEEHQQEHDQKAYFLLHS